MKKIAGTFFIALLVWMALPTRSVAQDYYGTSPNYKTVNMGITFSPNLSWLRYGENDNFDGKAGLGFAYGLITDFSLSENYYFSTGLLINTLWTEATNREETPSVRAQHRLQYAEIPLAVKLKSIQQYHRSYYGKFGFTTGLRLSGRERLDDADKRTRIDGANAFRLALQIGGGVEWQLDHNLRLMTGLTFNNGFTRAMKVGEPKNSYLSLDFGVFF